MKNTLIQYQGGGYSGCIWEWNFFYLDENGKFFDIYSSGCSGIDNKKDGLKILDKQSTYVYPLNDKNKIKEFATETHTALVKMVIEWFENNNIDHPFYAICKICGREINIAEEMVLEPYYAKEIYCYECYNMSSCSCGEFYEPDEDEYNGLVTTKEKIQELWDLPDKIVDMLLINYIPCCEYCLEKLAKRELEDMIVEWNEKWRIA